jgi:ATP-dependent RNA/DNA helicase IGHMBP2
MCVVKRQISHSPSIRFRAKSATSARHQRGISAITLTRSKPQGEIGFLSDIRRMNVGMTRARRKLLLVGDSSALCRHPFFGELLAYVKGVGGYRTANELA